MLRFVFRAWFPATVLAASLLGVLAGGGLVGCTVTPDYFPPCVNPYVDTCPVGDASPDGNDGGEELDGTAAIDAFSPDATIPDASTDGEAGQVTMQ